MKPFIKDNLMSAYDRQINETPQGYNLNVGFADK